MKKIFIFSAFCCLMLGTQQAHAAKKMKLAVDAALSVPMGDWSLGSNVGIGGLLRLEYAMMPKIALTGRTGYIFHFEKNNSSVSTLPILLGAKYYILDEYAGLYVAGELGASVNFASNGTADSSDTAFAMAYSVGYEWKRLDFRGGFFMPDVGDAFGFMFNVGGTLASF